MMFGEEVVEYKFLKFKVVVFQVLLEWLYFNSLIEQLGGFSLDFFNSGMFFIFYSFLEFSCQNVLDNFGDDFFVMFSSKFLVF